MSVLTFVRAINAALREEMARDPSIVLLGQDIGRSGGVFRATAGLQREFGAQRVFDTPVSEAGMVGTAVGLCMAGLRPVCEIQFDSFSYPAMNQIIAHVSRYRWRTRGTVSMPMVLRMPSGGGVRAPELHSESPEAYFCHTAGLKVVMASSPADAKGLLVSAIRDPDPVVFLEPKKLYRSLEDDVPDAEHTAPLGRVRTVRDGRDVTLIAWGGMVEVAVTAADLVARRGIECHVCDLRTLSPLDEIGILRACTSGRILVVQEAPRSCSVASEVVARIAESPDVRLRAPIQRVCGFDVPYPFPELEEHHRPNVARVVHAIKRALGASNDGNPVSSARPW